MQYDIERLLDALRHTESRGNRFAVSPKGARGPYQFMPETAREFGLVGNDVYDEQKSRAAARKKLSGLISRYGLEGGLGAYNMGEGNLEKNKGNWRAIPETAKYVPSVLAAYQGQGGTLSDAGFRSYQKPKKDRFPIIPGPKLPPEIKIAPYNGGEAVAQVKEQPKTGLIVDIAKQQKALQEARRNAEIFGNVDWGNPNAMVGDRVVETSPITVLANSLRNYMGIKGLKEADAMESDIETQKAQAMSDMLASGQAPDLTTMAQNGLIGPKELAAALMQRAGRPSEYQFLPGSGGQWLKGNKGTGEILPTEFKNPIYDPAAIQQNTGIKEALKGGQFTDSEGREGYAPALQRNPYYGQFLGGNQPVYDYPTGMMGNQGDAPTPAMPPQQPAPMMSQTPGQKAAQIEQAKQPYELGNAAAKAQIENQAKLQGQQQTDQYTKKKDANDALSIINEAMPLIGQSTESFVGNVRDQALGLVGASTSGAEAAAQLKALGGALVSKMPKMSGPQSDKDVLLYKEMAGQIGDPTVPSEQKMAAIKIIKAMQEKYAGVQSQPVQPAPAGAKFLGFE